MEFKNFYHRNAEGKKSQWWINCPAVWAMLVGLRMVWWLAKAVSPDVSGLPPHSMTCWRDLAQFRLYIGKKLSSRMPAMSFWKVPEGSGRLRKVAEGCFQKWCGRLEFGKEKKEEERQGCAIGVTAGREFILMSGHERHV